MVPGVKVKLHRGDGNSIGFKSEKDFKKEKSRFRGTSMSRGSQAKPQRHKQQSPQSEFYYYRIALFVSLCLLFYTFKNITLGKGTSPDCQRNPWYRKDSESLISRNRVIS